MSYLYFNLQGPYKRMNRVKKYYSVQKKSILSFPPKITIIDTEITRTTLNLNLR